MFDDILDMREVMAVHGKHTFIDASIVDFTSQEVKLFCKVSIFMKGKLMNTTQI